MQSACTALFSCDGTDCRSQAAGAGRLDDKMGTGDWK